MANQSFSTANNFSLSGGQIEGELPIQSFETLEIDVAVTENNAGNTSRGAPTQEPRPGVMTFGEPSFSSPITQGNMKLWNWWKTFYPENGQPGQYQFQDITFSFKGENNSVVADWQLIGAFPKKYAVSSGSVSETTLATETITLVCKRIIRRS